MPEHTNGAPAIRLRDEYLTVEQVLGLAEFRHLNPSTLARWRCCGKGPSFVKIGRKPFYRLSEIERWLLEREEHPAREVVRNRITARNQPAAIQTATRTHRLGGHKTKAEKRAAQLLIVARDSAD